MESSSRLKILKAAATAAGLLAVPAAVQVANLAHLRRALDESVAYEGPPAVDGIYGAQYPGAPVNLVGTGDSLLAGLWAGNRTSMQWVALLLANEIQRPVELFNVAVTGAKVSDLDRQLQKADGRLEGRRPDVVLLSVGATDIQDRNKFGKVRGHMRDILDEWNRRGGQVVVATPPPMDAPTPLNGNVGGKYIGGKAAQWGKEEKEFVRKFANHGHGVTLADFGELMRVFYDNRRLFASGDPTHPQPDDFHPGSLGQEVAAGLVIPSVLKAYRQSRDAAGNPLPAHPTQKDFDRYGNPIPGQVRNAGFPAAEHPPGSMRNWYLTGRPAAGANPTGRRA